MVPIASTYTHSFQHKPFYTSYLFPLKRNCVEHIPFRLSVKTTPFKGTRIEIDHLQKDAVTYRPPRFVRSTLNLTMATLRNFYKSVTSCNKLLPFTLSGTPCPSQGHQLNWPPWWRSVYLFCYGHPCPSQIPIRDLLPSSWRLQSGLLIGAILRHQSPQIWGTTRPKNEVSSRLNSKLIGRSNFRPTSP